MRCELAPELKGEFTVGRRKGTDKMIFEHLDDGFGRVNRCW